jgi:hypothetical protein
VSTISRTAVPVARTSRAVERLIEPGNEAVCPHCNTPVKFVARIRGRQVIANIYVEARWDRVEQYHLDCYVAAAEPYGAASL